MKKILTILIITCTALTACKKDNHTKSGGSGALQSVIFQVGFSQTTSGFETNLKLNDADTSVTNNVDLLFYMVFDSAGKNLHNVTQQKGDSGFGTFTDHLPAGSYTMAIAGAKAGSTIAVQGDLTKQRIRPATGTDLFFKKITFVVTTVPSTQNVNLERVNSRVKIVIKDAIPAGVALITVTLTPMYTDWYVGSASPILAYGQTYVYNIPATAIGTTNYTITPPDFLADGGGMVAVDISAGGHLSQQENTLIKDKVAEKIINASTGQNKITVLTGNLFGGNGTTGGDGFTISLPDWNTPITKGF